MARCHCSWSCIVPRLSWRGAFDPDALEKAQRSANREIRLAFELGLGIYLPHPDIKFRFKDLYREDGVHLFEKGVDMFLKGLQ